MTNFGTLKLIKSPDHFLVNERQGLLSRPEDSVDFNRRTDHFACDLIERRFDKHSLPSQQTRRR
jgi:hypothetical protein